MGVILDKPVVDKEVTLFSQSEHKGAVVSMQGYRVSMEDAFVAAPSMAFDHSVGLYGIFDGHGGQETSRYCADHFRLFLEKQAEEAGLDSVWLCSLLNR